MGRNAFNAAEVDAIAALLDARAGADRDVQPECRRRLRALGFHISDWEVGLTSAGLHDLVRRGAISISTQHRPRAAAPGSCSPEGAPPDVLEALAGPLIRVGPSVTGVPRSPGLYAVHGAEDKRSRLDVWTELGLGTPPDDRPLYVGKAQASLLGRDVRQHFGTGRTGSSTLRRSLAALLQARLDLRPIPRSAAGDNRFTHFALTPDSDARLTEWMTRYLRLAVWAAPGGDDLLTLERRVLGQWHPPLNLKDVLTPWRVLVESRRRAMAQLAAGHAPQSS